MFSITLWLIQGDLGWNIWPFNLRRAATRGSSAVLALELQPAGEKDISTCWGRVGGLITGEGRKKGTDLVSQSCCSLWMRRGPAGRWGSCLKSPRSDQKVTVSRSEGLLASMHPKPSRDEDPTFLFPLYLSWLPGNNSVSTLKSAAITCQSITGKNHQVKSLAAPKRQRKEENTAEHTDTEEEVRESAECCSRHSGSGRGSQQRGNLATKRIEI